MDNNNNVCCVYYTDFCVISIESQQRVVHVERGIERSRAQGKYK